MTHKDSTGLNTAQENAEGHIWSLPHKPNDMDVRTWEAILARSGERCEVGCETPCDTVLEVGHIHARGLHGETSFANCRLECRNHNRAMQMAADPRWLRKTWFDEGELYGHLRNSQILAGPNAVEQNASIFSGELRLKLLKVVSLLAMSCGVGKTMTMVGVLFAINQAVGYSGPRVQRVLWFVKERALGRQLKHELGSEVVAVARTHKTAPSVYLATTPGDLAKKPGHNDFVISCPHALWDVEGRGRSDEEVRRILSNYDVIIWDECDFAQDQMDRLVKLGDHALKFGLTATPVDSQGNFLTRNYVLAGAASHNMAYGLDLCVKPLKSFEEAVSRGYFRAFSHANHTRLISGEEHDCKGMHVETNTLPGDVNTIIQAMQDASALEKDMRSNPAWADSWYSPHIIVRCKTRPQARQLYSQVRHALEAGQIDVSGLGWNLSMTFQKEPGRKEDEDIEDMSPDHPFMHAKNNNGRCTEDSSRVLFIVNMGVRGLNCWPALFGVDLRMSDSVNDQCQFDGRFSRMGPILPRMSEDPNFIEYTHPRYYWPAAKEKEECPAKAAYEFILDMDRKIEESGICTWADFAAGDILVKTQGRKSVLQTRMTIEDMVDLAEKVATEADVFGSVAAIPDENIKRILGSINPDKDKAESWWKQAEETVEKMMVEKPKIEVSPIQKRYPVCREKPKEIHEYGVTELFDYVKNDFSVEDYSRILQKIDSDVDYRHIVAKHKQAADRARFKNVNAQVVPLQAPKGWGVLSSIMSEIDAKLKERGVKAPEFRIIAIVTSEVVSKMYDVTHIEGPTTNGGPIDKPAYHYDLADQYVRKLIKEQVIARLVQRNHLKCSSVLGVKFLGDDDGV